MPFVDWSEWETIYWLFGIWFVLRTLSAMIAMTWDTILFNVTNPDPK